MARMSLCKSCPTLVDIRQKMSTKYNTPYEDQSLYWSLVRALYYLTFIWLELSYAIHKILPFMHNLMDDHMHALRSIMRYIKGLYQYELQLYLSYIISLIAYTYADWCVFSNTRRSTSGYYVFLNDNLVSWYSKF